MDRIRTYVICNHGRYVAIDDVARFVGMNKSAFCVFFRKMAGKTFVQYLNEYRIQMACRMLEKGEKSVSEVCYAVGFGDVPYFHLMFKRTTGVSPGKYKEDCKQEQRDVAD